MENVFIYVFSEESYKQMINIGFHFMKKIDGSNAYVFLYDKSLYENIGDIEHVSSSTLTFSAFGGRE